ncbi:MAG: TetR/AcrR family transcriptional regulator [Pseudomonadota bacterium]
MARKQGSHAEITGPRLRDAALRLIAQHGYAAVSMRQIADAVGVKAGALYNYVPDKQSLLFGLMEDHLTSLLAAWQTAPVSADPIQALEAFTRFHLRFHLPRPDQVSLAYMELRNLSPENFARIEGLRRDYEAALEEILQAGQQSGAFAVADTRVCTMALIAMLTGPSTWFRDDGRLPQAEIEAIYWRMVRGAVTAKG